MRRLADFRRFSFVILLVLTSAVLMAQSQYYSGGDGTKEHPYEISRTSDWNAFADTVTRGIKDYNGKFFILTQNITINVYNDTDTVPADKIAGSWTSDDVYNPFSGTFDGNWHTITFNVGLKKGAYIPGQISDDKPFPSAPFRVIDGATINNLHVAGKIKSTRKYNSGLVGFAFSTKYSGRTNYINNCTSNIIIDCSKILGGNSDCSAAGFLAENKANGKTVFENCVFNGTIDKGELSSGDKCGGFVSYNNGKSLAFTNCTMNGSITLTGTKKANFYRNKPSSGTYTLTESYYTKNNYGGDGTGTAAPTEEPDDKIVKKYIYGSTTYYVPGAEITGLETTTYSYISGQTITIDAPVVSYYGKTLTRGTDYVIKVNDVQEDGAITLSAAGNYDIKIEAKAGSAYGGSQTTTIKVVEFNSWAVVQEYLADASLGERIITLNADITPENPKNADMTMEVNGTVVLNLNGKTIDRGLFSKNDSIVKGQVMRINSGANLTINGEGIITGGFNWAATDDGGGEFNDGGGIYNVGNLRLNNVTIQHNKCVKKTFYAPGTTNPNTSNTARGGGVYSGGGSLIIKDGEIVSNEARGGGGGVYGNSANPFIMKFVEVSSNTSESKGGGIRVKTQGVATAIIDTCEIVFNFVTDKKNVSQGAGIYMEGGNLEMNNCEVSGNQSTMNGSGIYLANGKITAVNCSILGNGSYYESNDNLGGGVYLRNGTFIMDGGTIAHNNSMKNGAGIFINDDVHFQVKGNVQIQDNTKVKLYVTEPTPNNAYLIGSSTIEVVGELGEDAIINITPNVGGGTYVTFADPSYSTDAMEHFKLDDNEYSLIIDDDGNLEVYKPYSWDNTDTWNGTIAENKSEPGTIPTSESDIKIHRSLRISSDCEAKAANITIDSYCNIIIEDGGQLVTNSAVAVVAEKNVVAANEVNQTGWYLISSSVNNTSIEDNTNLLTTESWGDATYDLYRFNETAELQWENYRADHEGFTTLQNGRGYLYRNADNHKINIDGTLNVSDITYNLSCSGSELTGFNLIGNPYSQNITLLNTTLVDNSGDQIVDGDSNPINLTGFYRLTADGSAWTAEITSGDEATIAPLEGFLVQVDEPRTVKFSRTPRGGSKSNGDNIKFTVANSQYEDVAYALFENGLGLNKIEHMNEDVPMVYININKEDFAIATLNDEVKQFNLNFEAKTTGKYTLKLEKTGAYRYLHLIDKVAEKDINLLEENEYSFIGSPADSKDRFIVRLENSADAENPVFAYQNGSDIVVCGEGELQVFDMMGRLISKQYVNGVETMRTSSLKTGVYVFRLNDMTQKIVIR